MWAHRVVILITFFIYIRAGREIYQKHKQLHQFSASNEPEPLSSFDNAYGSSKTTEVFVTSEAMDLPPRRHGLRRRPGRAPRLRGQQQRQPARTAQRGLQRHHLVEQAQPTRIDRHRAADPEQHGDHDGAARGAAHRASAAAAPARQRAQQRGVELHQVCAALLHRHPHHVDPSSANRVYSVVHPDQISLPLEFMSAMVLPLQGFWNMVIYVVTSWKACQMLFADLRLGRRPAAGDMSIGGFGRGGNAGGFRAQPDPFARRNVSPKSYESESMTELAISRPSSNDRRGL